MSRLFRLPVLVGLLATLPALGASAEQIPGFFPGNWVFMTKADASAAEIEDQCRSNVTIVTEPNNAVTLTFEDLDPPDAATGKKLQGKIIFSEICPEMVANEVICPGRDPSASSLLPNMTKYRVIKRANGTYEILTSTKDMEPASFFPVSCPRAIIEAVSKTALLPPGVQFQP